MVGVSVAGFRMHQYCKAVAIKHQPWHDARKLLGVKGDLVHRLRMRSYRHVAPTTHHHLEMSLDEFANARGTFAHGLIVVDMRVIALYTCGIDHVVYIMPDVLRVEAKPRASFERVQNRDDKWTG